MEQNDAAKSKIDKLRSNSKQLSHGNQPRERKPFRSDGYVNMLNKYGTGQDNSEAYGYQLENQTPDTVLTEQYETNGLFAKIIDIPAQEAVKRGFKLNIEDQNVEEYVQKKVRDLKFFTAVEDALKWSRLYGGAIAVMIINDGVGNLSQPVDWRSARAIEDIVVYEKSSVTPDYGSMYSDYGVYGIKRTSKFRMPEYYNVFSIYGSFRVHESRCLLFRNGKMPEHASTQDYRFWGVPEYNRIKRALRETITAHGDAVKLLERSVQAVYKMKDLAQLLSTDEGEEKALRRLQIIDMARGILNSIAIDNDGEDYDFKTSTLSGVNEVIDASCNMLSALTEIPQTKLFGRSPAGMSATGESDLENYYSFIDKLRETQIKDNLSTLIDGIICTGINTGKLKVKPDYDLEFEPLWTEKETDRAAIDSQLAQTDLVKAQTAQMYIELGILDPSEERRRLKNEGKFGIVDEELPQQDNPLDGMLEQFQNKDSADDPYGGATGVGVIVVKDGKILVGNRNDTNEVSGPGGHIENWEDAERAAWRETEEEFGIELSDLTPIGLLDNLSPEYGKSFIFLSTDFKNSPLTNTQEMVNSRFSPLSELKNEALYEPFKKGLDKLLYTLSASRMDAYEKKAEELDWITTENGANVPLENGKAAGGPMEGMDFSNAKLEKGGETNGSEASTTTQSGKISKKSSENGLTSSAFSDKIKNTNTPPLNAEGKKTSKPVGKLTNEECEKIDSDFHHRLETGEQSKKIIAKKQSVHIKGTASHEKTLADGIMKSYFNISEKEVQKLADDFCGKGNVRHYGNYPSQIIEDVDCGRVIGYALSKDGRSTATTHITIHYSAKGVHIVPTMARRK